MKDRMEDSGGRRGRRDVDVINVIVVGQKACTLS